MTRAWKDFVHIHFQFPPVGNRGSFSDACSLHVAIECNFAQYCASDVGTANPESDSEPVKK